MPAWLGVAVLIVLVYVAWRGERVLRLGKKLRGELHRLRHEGIAHVTRGLQSVAMLEYELELDRPLPPTRGFAASPDLLLHLATHIRRNRPGLAVECGSGVSTLVLARALQLAGRGHVHSLENDAAFAEETRAMLRDYGVDEFATVHAAPLEDHAVGGATWRWYATGGLPAGTPIDLLFVDGPHEEVQPLARYPAGPLLFGRLAPDAVVVLDDAARAGEKAAVRRWLDEFPRLQARELPTEDGCVVLERVRA